jgi:hypothetical protein
LWIAAEACHTEVVDALVAAGADVNAADKVRSPTTPALALFDWAGTVC